MGTRSVCVVLLLLVSLVVGDYRPGTTNNNNNNNINNINNNNNTNHNNPPSTAYKEIKRSISSLTDPIPSHGDQRLLVLTVGYNQRGMKGAYSGLQWKNGLFAEWVQFFRAQSYNKLRYTVDVVTMSPKGTPVINDPASNYIPLQEPLSTYANGEHGWNFGSEWSLDTIVRNTCRYLDAKRFNWGPYIRDGKIENVIILSAGYDYRYGEKSKNAKSNYLLSTSTSGVDYQTSSGALLHSYTFCSEHTQDLESPPNMANLGQCAHEFGHALGIPDLYDLSLKTSGVGYFDMLGYGLYANGHEDGSLPVGFGAFSKSYLGWSEPQEIRSSSEVKLGPVSKAVNNTLKIYPDKHSNDTFFLIENRQPLDKWDRNFDSQYGSGIVIWFVNDADVKKYTVSNSVNTYPIPYLPCPEKPSVIVIEADGRQDMCTYSESIKYGSAEDVWQVGGQYIISNKLSIGIMALQDKTFTIRISFNGTIDMHNTTTGVSSSSSILSYGFVLIVFVFLCNLL